MRAHEFVGEQEQPRHCMGQGELEPCPFCDGFAHVFQVDYHGYKVICGTCGAQTKSYELVEYAIARWNRRAQNAEECLRV